MSPGRAGGSHPGTVSVHLLVTGCLNVLTDRTARAAHRT